MTSSTTAAKKRVRGRLTPSQAVPGPMLCTRCFYLARDGQDWADHGPTGTQFARVNSPCERRQVEIRMMNQEAAAGGVNAASPRSVAR